MPPDLFEVRRWIEKVDHDLTTAEAALNIELPADPTITQIRQALAVVCEFRAFVLGLLPSGLTD